MDTHPQALMVSESCSGYMHGNCRDEKCKCNCHQVCAKCLIKCQATYDASEIIGEEHLVCADCYVLITKNRKKPRCEGGCGATTAYRNPAVGDFYLCMNCHKQYAIDQANPLNN